MADIILTVLLVIVRLSLGIVVARVVNERALADLSVVGVAGECGIVLVVIPVWAVDVICMR